MKEKLKCPICGSKRVKLLRYVYECSVCKTKLDKRDRRVIGTDSINNNNNIVMERANPLLVDYEQAIKVINRLLNK